MDMRSRRSPFERYHPLYRPMTRSTAVQSSALTSTALKLGDDGYACDTGTFTLSYW